MNYAIDDKCYNSGHTTKPGPIAKYWVKNGLFFGYCQECLDDPKMAQLFQRILEKYEGPFSPEEVEILIVMKS